MGADTNKGMSMGKRVGAVFAWIRERWVGGWSAPAVLGSIFFALSLTPSLLPRPLAVQGLISGLSLAAGYGLGVWCVWLWRSLELPLVTERTRRGLGMVSAVICGGILLGFLWKSARWQDTVREVMGMEPSGGEGPYLLALMSAVVFGVLWFLVKIFQRVVAWITVRLNRRMPSRVALLLGYILTLVIFWMMINGVLVRTVLQVADRSFQQLDALMEADVAPPTHPERAGGPMSLVDWEDLGRQGRVYVSQGPGAEELGRFFGRPMPVPIRVYVGLNSASSAEERAELALRELIRAGGFDRSLLLLVTPTGTGWVDPAGIDPVEYLHRGDIASVAAQYSYLNSPLSLLTQAAYGAEMARELFEKIYGHWRSLPRDSRPRLFLHGLSLGALNSDLSYDSYDIIDDPFDGALWSGPPFRTATWRQVTADREPGSPAWLPVFRRGSVVRFANQEGVQELEGTWGHFRILFLQYASDPITFFDPSMMWREPAWMRPPRGSDVTGDLSWFPLVTMLQVAADMMVGTAPAGFGHQYAATDYLDAWVALTEPEGWSAEELQRLRDFFEEK